MTNKELLGQLLVRYRLKHNLSQIELAKKLGCSNSSLCKFETGKHNDGMKGAYFFQVIDLILPELEFIIKEKMYQYDKEEIESGQSNNFMLM